jgi:hypothetical protein
MGAVRKLVPGIAGPLESPHGEPKVEAICRRITNVWRTRARLMRRAPDEWITMQRAHSK